MPADETRLSQIATRWSLLLQAHGPDDSARHAALAELLPRYCAAVYRYLRGLVRDEAAAEELCQEFALRFVRGDFRHADPSRGRFRNYLKVVLVHLAREHARRGRAQPTPADHFEVAVTPPTEEEDRLFLELWRKELLGRTWSALAEASAANDDRFYEVLRLKSSDPSRTSTTLAEELTRSHGRSFTPEGVRQTLHRARARFAELLRAEVAASVPTDDPDEVNAELADLGLLVYCPPG
jgi:RNA polymerase sigma-70 factor (ECF subfamily)